MVAIRFAEDLAGRHRDVMLFQHRLTKVPSGHAAIGNPGKEIERAVGGRQFHVGALAQCSYPKGVTPSKFRAHFG